MITGFQLFLLGIDAIVGVGIYLSAGGIVALTGTFSSLVFLSAGVVLSFIAMSFCHLTKADQRSGGPYIYAARAFGKKWAYPIGFVDWLGSTLGLGAFAVLIAEVLTPFFSWAYSGKLCAAAFLMACCIANVYGTKLGVRLMATLSILKTLPVLALAVSGVVFFGFSSGENVISNPSFAKSSPLLFTSFSEALILALFCCQGFEIVPVVSGESRNPSKNIGLATITSLWFAVGIYTALVWCMSHASPHLPNDIFELGKIIWGPLGERMMRVTALLSALGIMAGKVLALPRYLLPLADDGFLPRRLSETTRSSPHTAVVVTSVIALLVLFAGSVKDLINISSLGISLQYLVSAVALLTLSWGRSNKNTAIAFLAAAAALFFIVQVPLSAWGQVLVIVLVGYLAFGFNKYFKPADSKQKFPSALS